LVETDAEYRWARAALAALRPEHRRVLRLREVEGWSYDRIAEHEGVTVESVRGSLRRARVGLRAAYARIVSSAPLLVLLALVRGVRRQVESSVQRLQTAAANGAPIAARAGDAFAAILALALGTGAAVLPLAGEAPVAQAAGRNGGVVTSIAGEGTTTTTGAVHSGTSPRDAGTAAGARTSPRDSQTSPLP